MIREVNMKYMTSIIPDQVVHDVPLGVTNIPAIVTHVIEIEGEQWGCAYPLQHTALKIERKRKRRIEIGNETVEFEMGDDTTWVRTTIEGRTWMSVRKQDVNSWVREGGTDDWYLERLLELGITPDEVLYPRKKRPVAKHENPIPVAPKRTPCDVIAVKDAHTPDNMLYYLSDSIDENRRALFEGRCSFDAAWHAVTTAFPNTPLLQGKAGPNTWYIQPVEVIHEPKKTRRNRKA